MSASTAGIRTTAATAAAPLAARPATRGGPSGDARFRDALDRAAGLEPRSRYPNLPPPCPGLGSAQDGCGSPPSEAKPQGKPSAAETDGAVNSDGDAIDERPESGIDGETPDQPELADPPGEIEVVAAPTQRDPVAAPVDPSLDLEAGCGGDELCGEGTVSPDEAAQGSGESNPSQSPQPGAAQLGEQRAAITTQAAEASQVPRSHKGAGARSHASTPTLGGVGDGVAVNTTPGLEPSELGLDSGDAGADAGARLLAEGSDEPSGDGFDAANPASSSGLGPSTPAHDAASTTASATQATTDAAQPVASAPVEARAPAVDPPQPQPQPDAQSPEDEANLARTERGLGAALRQRGGSVTLRLTPAELGTIRIEMRVSEGSVVARLTAEHDSAHALLTRNLGELKQSLQARGLLVERLEVVTLAQPNTGASGAETSGERGAEARGRENEGRSQGRWDQGGREGRAPARARPAKGFADWLESPVSL